MIHRSDLMGHWDSEWEQVWGSLETPEVNAKGALVLKSKEHKKKTLGLFGGEPKARVVTFADQELGNVRFFRAM